MIRYWRKKKDVMQNMPKRQKTFRIGVAKFPTLERKLNGWVTTQRENCRAVTTAMIRLIALCKGIQVALGFQIPASGSRIWSRGFRIPYSRFPPKWILDFIEVCGFWIPYNGFRIPSHRASLKANKNSWPSK